MKPVELTWISYTFIDHDIRRVGAVRDDVGPQALEFCPAFWHTNLIQLGTIGKDIDRRAPGIFAF